jgi:hypothetical protein
MAAVKQLNAPATHDEALALLEEVGARYKTARAEADAASVTRDEALCKTAELISRRKAARATGLTPGRVQQIIDARD